MAKTCKITHAITEDSYPGLSPETLKSIISDFKIGDTVNVKKVSFWNGGHHVRGYLNGTSKMIELPLMWTNYEP